MSDSTKFEKYSGEKNMSLDISLLDFVIDNKIDAKLRLYGWSAPTITIGRNQKTDNINLNFCKNNSINIVKRPTGGRAIYHYDEITYCFICSTKFLKNGESIIASYKEISDAIIYSFQKIGIVLDYAENQKIDLKKDYCMSLSTGADLSYNGKKLIGSAQYRKNNYILQHGSIPFNIDKETINEIFMEKNDFSQITTLNQISQSLTHSYLYEILKKGFGEKFKTFM